MEFFLHEVAEKIGKKHNRDMNRVAVVFNNRRPFQFLKKELSKVVEIPFFPPTMMTMDDLVRQISGSEIVQKEFLLFDLYDVYRKSEAYESRKEQFEEFISIGEMMLSDFSEIDLYRVDAQQLFSNVDDAKRIEAWGKTLGSDKSQPSDLMKNYLKFYHSLYGVYSAFRQHLAKDNRAYSGMAYRMVADMIDSKIDDLRYEHVYFVGFNALSESEKHIVQAFVKQGRGSIIADGDDYYYTDISQESGHFLRMMQKQFPQAGFFPVHEDHFDSHFASDKKINVVACPENVLQAKYVGQFLTDLTKNCDKEQRDELLKNTAIVLADEKMLVPVLNSLPEGIAVNVTMGFPFAHSMVCNFVLKLLELHRNCHADRFYYEDVVSVLSDSFVCRLAGYDVKPSQIVRWLNEKHLVYSSLSDIMDMLNSHNTVADFSNEVIERLFSSEASSVDGMIKLWNYCLDAIEQAMGSANTQDDEDVPSGQNLPQEDGRKESNVFEKEANVLKGLRTVVSHFIELQERYHFIDNLATLRKIYDRFVRRLSVSLIGEPLQGLQITGMLEARNLDFDRVILVSAGEGVLPAGMSGNSLIPYDLKGGVLAGYNPHTGDYIKRGAGMPTYNDRDAVYANHFYSLIQRASEIHLVYCTDPDASGKGEPSRFVMQVRDELAPRYNIKVNTINVLAPHSTTLSHYIVGEKTDEVMLRLREMVDGEEVERYGRKTIRALSPSALNTFNSCQMRFYYQYVLRMREQDELAEEAEASDLGDCVHAVLEDVFRPVNGQLIVTMDILDKALLETDKMIEQWFSERYGEEGAKVGRNYMMQQVAKRQVKNYIKFEREQIVNGFNTTILSVESGDLSASMDITLSNDEVVRAYVAGRADRIDTVSSSDETFLRIVDYKTGSVLKTDLEYHLDSNNVPDKWFQVMFYAWLYKKNHPGTHEDMLSGIIPLRRNEPQFMNAVIKGAKDEASDIALNDAAFEVFEKELRNRLQLLFEPENFKPLSQSERTGKDHSKCAFCPVLAFCRLQPDAEKALD